MAKKKSCENICRPQVVSEAEGALYGWVDEEIFSQPFVITANMLPELCQGMSLTESGASEGDYVIEAACPSDRFLSGQRRIGSTSCPRSILPVLTVPVASAGTSASSPLVVVPPGPSAKSKKVPLATSAKKPICLDGEEGVKEDPSADLKQKRRKHKLHESFPENVVLGDDVAWEHETSPLDCKFPADFNYWAALDSGITQSSVRKALGHMPPEQLLGTAHRYACKLTACLQVELESVLSSMLKVEKELAAAKDQGHIFDLSPLQAKIDSLTEQLSVAQGERLSALEQLSQVEEDSKVQAVELQSCRAALDEEREKVETLTRSLKEKQMTLGMVEAAADHWYGEWKSLVAEIEEIVQETFEDPKGQRIYNLKEEAGECSEAVVEVQPEHPEGPQQVEAQLEETVPEEDGECPA
ncbi:hypothetical protein PIB30_066631 [Stylosanthes scabra]|uniref:Uncharacterized protein n=1 Tax=Stylosanthes scabra TaxID=79078 RepID=A0ABU6XN47_9FABA|nr:hypothetical protein [Stylosanthes scabra]